MVETEHDAQPGRLLAGTSTSELASCVCIVDSGIATQAERLAVQTLGGVPTLVRSFRQLRQEPWSAVKLVFRRFDVAIACVTDVEHLYRDLILTYLAVLRARRKVLCDVRGGRIVVDAATGVRAFLRCLGDLAVSPLLYSRARWATAVRFRSRRRVPGRGARAAEVAYLRANLWQESRAGGSVAHTTGVVVGLNAAGFLVRYVGTARLSTLDGPNIEVHLVPAGVSRLRNVPDLPFAAYGEVFAQRAYALLRDRPPSFVYQRYAVLNLSGADLARRLGRPFVLEYNGSEVWVTRHWGSRLIFEGLAARIETREPRLRAI